MAVIVFDDFNRANSPTLGTATTGQVWTQVSGNLGIDSNQALFTWLVASSPGTTIATIESGITNLKTSLTLPSVDVPNFAAGIGFVFRYVNTNYYWRLLTFDFPGDHGQLRLQRVYAGSTSTVIDIGPDATADGDVISATACGPLFEIFVNGVSVGTYDDTTSPKNYGTQCGLIGIAGSTFFDFTNFMDDFQVETIDDCPNPSASWLLAPLIWSAAGTVETIPSGISTVRFDSGLGNEWYITAALTDSGQELRSKNLKSVRVTGKLTNADAMQYGYDVSTPIVVTDLEDGLNSSTGPIPLDNTTVVAESQRWQTNVPNSVLSTARVSGNDTGETERDQVHEIVVEIAEQGVRR